MYYPPKIVNLSIPLFAEMENICIKTAKTRYAEFQQKVGLDKDVALNIYHYARIKQMRVKMVKKVIMMVLGVEKKKDKDKTKEGEAS